MNERALSEIRLQGHLVRSDLSRSLYCRVIEILSAGAGSTAARSRSFTENAGQVSQASAVSHDFVADLIKTY